MKKTITPRGMLLIIAGMFLLPLVLAWFMYTGALDFEPESTKNRGILIVPPVPLDWRQANLISPASGPVGVKERLLEHWVLVYPVHDKCDVGCQQALVSLRQVHLASGRHGSRIRMVALFMNAPAAETEKTIGEIYDQYLLAVDDSGVLHESIQSASTSTSFPLSTYLIDPLGNIMMAYAVEADPNDIKTDLKQLLTWSKLDEQ